MKTKKTAEAWAARITESYRRSVAALIKVGKELTEAKAALQKHGDEWLRMFRDHPRAVKRPLPFDQTTARRWMKIARNPILSNPAHAPVLPYRWTTLYELDKLPQPVLQALVDGKEISPGMERADAKAIRHAMPAPFPSWKRKGWKLPIAESIERGTAVAQARSLMWTAEGARQRIGRAVYHEFYLAPGVPREGAREIILEILREIVEDLVRRAAA